MPIIRTLLSIIPAIARTVTSYSRPFCGDLIFQDTLSASMKCLKPTLLSVTTCFRQESRPRCLDNVDSIRFLTNRNSLRIVTNIHTEHEEVHHCSNNLRHRHLLIRPHRCISAACKPSTTARVLRLSRLPSITEWQWPLRIIEQINDPMGSPSSTSG